MALPRCVRHLSGAQPALFPGSALHHARGKELRHQHARPGGHLFQTGQPLRLPVRYQRRRFGQQDVPVPADQGPAHGSQPRKIPPRKDPDPRHGSLPAVSPGYRHRRHLGRNQPQDCQGSIDRLSRCPAHAWQRRRSGFPRPRMGSQGFEDLSGIRPRRAVRRKILRTRRPGHPHAASRGFVPGGHRGKLLGRPEHQGQDHRGGYLPRTARKTS